MESSLGPSWAWGLSLIALTIVAHAMGVVMIALVLTGIRSRVIQRGQVVRHPILFAVTIVGTVGLLLALLHGAEAIIWAAAYLWLGALNSYADAILYSLDSMTTRGASNTMLHGEWQLMGALEAADGMLLFGVSTAFVFAMIERILPMFVRPEGRRRGRL